MAKAVAIGGVFFRSKDNSLLADWYKRYLGVEEFWTQQGGFTVFAPFKENSDYFPADKQWMINFRVDDLGGLMETLREANIEIETRAEWDSPETGRFARIHDPEGNPIELWEAPPPAPTA